MWCDFMDSMFQSPLMLLKSGSMPSIGDDFDEEKAPTFETTKAQGAWTQEAAVNACERLRLQTFWSFDHSCPLCAKSGQVIYSHLIWLYGISKQYTFQREHEWNTLIIHSDQFWCLLGLPGAHCPREKRQRNSSISFKVQWKALMVTRFVKWKWCAVRQSPVFVSSVFFTVKCQRTVNEGSINYQNVNLWIFPWKFWRFRTVIPPYLCREDKGEADSGWRCHGQWISENGSKAGFFDSQKTSRSRSWFDPSTRSLGLLDHLGHEKISMLQDGEHFGLG